MVDSRGFKTILASLKRYTFRGRDPYCAGAKRLMNSSY
jgi:hypothetical protein